MKYIFTIIISIFILGCTDGQVDYWKALNTARHIAGVSASRKLKAEEYFDDSLQLKCAKAVKKGDTAAIRQCLNSGLDVNRFSNDTLSKLNLLGWSLMTGNKKSFSFLLKNGADPNKKFIIVRNDGMRHTDYEYHTCISYILDPWRFNSKPDYEWLELALKGGANPNGKLEYKRTVHGGIDSSHTVMDMVLWGGRADSDSKKLMKLFLRYNFDPNCYDSLNGENPVLLSSLADFEIAALLLEYGADPLRTPHLLPEYRKAFFTAELNAFLERGEENAWRDDKSFLHVRDQFQKRGVTITTIAGTKYDRSDRYIDSVFSAIGFARVPVETAHGDSVYSKFFNPLNPWDCNNPDSIAAGKAAARRASLLR